MRDVKRERDAQRLRQEFYDPLPCGIIELDAADEFTFENKAFTGLMKIAAQEFGGPGPARDLFAQACSINANKRSWIMRIFDQVTGGIIPLKVSPLPPSRAGRRWFCVEILAGAGPPSPPDQILYGRLRIDRLGNSAFAGRELIPLSGKEFDLLVFLAVNEDRVVTKQEIKRGIWQRQQVNPRAMDILMARLRRKLNAAGLDASTIATVHGRGYKLNAEKLHPARPKSRRQALNK